MLGDYRLTSVVMPAIMGLLPSPGGARFSAPLVAETLENSVVSNQEKAFINFWFATYGNLSCLCTQVL